MQQISSATSDTSPRQFIAARTLFSIGPTEPPSSPPPTSPLPPLPEIAPYRPSRTSSITNSTRSIRPSKPSRPPRPTTSLPNLKPRIIKSPEPVIREQCLVTTHRPFSPTTLERLSPIDVIPKPNLNTPQKRSSVRLPSPAGTPSFSDDVLAALPRLFQKSPAECRDIAVGRRVYSPGNEISERVRPWQVYHRSPSKSPTKPKPSKPTKKLVARSALFIPRSPSEGNEDVSGQSIYLMNAPSASGSSLFPTRRSSRKPQQPLNSVTELSNGSPASHKRSKALAGFAFDFGRQAYNRCNPTSPSNDNLTSLPRLPSTPTLDVLDLHQQCPMKIGTSRHRLHSPIDFCPGNKEQRSSQEEVAFFSVPYSKTLGQAATQSGTAHEHNVPIEAPSSQGSRSRPHSHQCSEDCIDLGDEGIQHVLTPEEKRKIKRKRMLWALATVFLLLVATGGILVGVIWKLENMS